MVENIVAFIPAWDGSKRIKNKNIKLLNGKPLIVYTIETALEAEIFNRIIVSINNAYITIMEYNIEISIVEHTGKDIDWIYNTMTKENIKEDYVMVLRPTNPFRTKETIIRAWEYFKQDRNADSLKSVEKCRQHPGKMWKVIDDNLMIPYFQNVPLYEEQSYTLPYQMLPEVYVQNGCIDIGETRNILFRKSFFGNKIMPFFTQGYEGFDINEEIDFMMAELLIQKNFAKLPENKNHSYEE